MKEGRKGRGKKREEEEQEEKKKRGRGRTEKRRKKERKKKGERGKGTEKKRRKKETEEKWIKSAPRRVLPLPRFDGAEREGSILEQESDPPRPNLSSNPGRRVLRPR